MTAAIAPLRFSEVLRVARLRDASDVHLAPNRPPVYRIDGALEECSASVVTADELEALAGLLIDAEAREALHREGDVTVCGVDEEAGRYRVHAYRAGSSTALAIRLLARDIPTLEQLQLPVIIRSLAQRSSGLVLVTGPTGSGKSTVLAALVEYINRTSARHIITIEDPVEYVHTSHRSLICQRSVPHDVGSFADAVYGALRSDPDVVLIGEMRDPQTIHAALTAAETGHLVLATLHTRDAAQTIDRIVSVFKAEAQAQIRNQLAQTLAGVVCLRLVPRSAGAGRIAAVELLLANDAVRSIIREAKTHQLRNVLITGRQSGMQTLESSLSDLIANGEITYESAHSATERPDDLQYAKELFH